MSITVLRVGHRPERDHRITTHVALVSRAFGADSISIWEKDEKIKKSIESVVKRWGGNFSVSFETYKQSFKKFNGISVHLTMYGLPFEDKIEEIQDLVFNQNKNLMIIVGAEKVPKEIYEFATYNLAVTGQPHSEISALALFLDRLHKGKEMKKEFNNAKLKIVPCEKGKNIIAVESEKSE
ncbi:MAG: tRNA (cytidine(56)-2'-O)-methyltransferase [Candidatus Methanofastidiosum methylothiophilum]|jgi:tRNA (cytidine56-2'-O)-methyltransferase|uniref:tRNA (cytidine(56)-2'-O)-methyltransferase n=1 Tax=Candidatus Methanofastidiosum methylothiophilum TaxID=1705564 RepID=A0A150IV47_9EURY|nr:MAG: tRNA (cytidine(56)-2'-O)-methyltransferase [Candidatus Methanofastidiosum methylthiophilus]NMC76923.1 tRNA (cytidine(56)-2'-O)-methyltransferase [Candidatus Methanofastidiosa archaeon]